ncbi:hypothetical protein J6590_036071 [Homalodisca vitripennis]|nr:hypothetical protein J6590_036071 [Homalodisca vitripennis]
MDREGNNWDQSGPSVDRLSRQGGSTLNSVRGDIARHQELGPRVSVSHSVRQSGPSVDRLSRQGGSTLNSVCEGILRGIKSLDLECLFHTLYGRVGQVWTDSPARAEWAKCGQTLPPGRVNIEQCVRGDIARHQELGPRVSVSHSVRQSGPSVDRLSRQGGSTLNSVCEGILRGIKSLDLECLFHTLYGRVGQVWTDSPARAEWAKCGQTLPPGRVNIEQCVRGDIARHQELGPRVSVTLCTAEGQVDRLSRQGGSTLNSVCEGILRGIKSLDLECLFHTLYGRVGQVWTDSPARAGQHCTVVRGDIARHQELGPRVSVSHSVRQSGPSVDRLSRQATLNSVCEGILRGIKSLDLEWRVNIEQCVRGDIARHQELGPRVSVSHSVRQSGPSVDRLSRQGGSTLNSVCEGILRGIKSLDLECLFHTLWQSGPSVDRLPPGRVNIEQCVRGDIARHQELCLFHTLYGRVGQVWTDFRQGGSTLNSVCEGYCAASRAWTSSVCFTPCTASDNPEELGPRVSVSHSVRQSGPSVDRLSRQGGSTLNSVCEGILRGIKSLDLECLFHTLYGRVGQVWTDSPGRVNIEQCVRGDIARHQELGPRTLPPGRATLNSVCEGILRGIKSLDLECLFHTLYGRVGQVWTDSPARAGQHCTVVRGDIARHQELGPRVSVSHSVRQSGPSVDRLSRQATLNSVCEGILRGIKSLDLEWRVNIEQLCEGILRGIKSLDLECLFHTLYGRVGQVWTDSPARAGQHCTVVRGDIARHQELGPRVSVSHSVRQSGPSVDRLSRQATLNSVCEGILRGIKSLDLECLFHTLYGRVGQVWTDSPARAGQHCTVVRGDIARHQELGPRVSVSHSVRQSGPSVDRLSRQGGSTLHSCARGYCAASRAWTSSVCFTLCTAEWAKCGQTLPPGRATLNSVCEGILRGIKSLDLECLFHTLYSRVGQVWTDSPARAGQHCTVVRGDIARHQELGPRVSVSHSVQQSDILR